jgi:hypothetical protein
MESQLEGTTFGPGDEGRSMPGDREAGDGDREMDAGRRESEDGGREMTEAAR